MTYPQTLVRLSMGGPLFGGLDNWSCNLHLGNPAQDAMVDLYRSNNVATDAIVEDVKAWMGRLGSRINAYAELEWVKFALIGPDGKYALSGSGDYAFVKEYTFSPVAGSHNVPVPAQLSVAITLGTGVARGLAKSGRIYPPLTGSVDASGYDQYAGERAASAGQLISDINGSIANAVGTGGDMDQVVVASKEREGAIRLVQSVRVGNVIDTQRKRRNAIREEYTNADVTVYPESRDDYELAS